MATQIYDIGKQMAVLQAEYLDLKEKTKRVTTTISKEKNEASNLQPDLENKLHTAEMKMNLAVERNFV